MSRLLSRGLTALAMAGAAVATSLVAAAPAQAASYYNLVNYKSGLCMSIAGGGSTANGAHVIQWGCNDGWEQVWRRSGNRLINGKSGKCLSLDNGGSTANGTHAIQWTCNDGPEQDWYPSGGYLVNGKSGKVASLDNGGSTAQGTHVIQWPSNGGSEQGWAFYLKYEEV
ncbi:RICIN domain-containing protein [Micromonospora sp. NPDC049523]|uniref:RICIN domain-containing protein n=1 Tax=Micromonospora sp. NPDC049523 TaxID=3155921 RepID=UPI0034285752